MFINQKKKIQDDCFRVKFKKHYFLTKITQKTQFLEHT